MSRPLNTGPTSLKTAPKRYTASRIEALQITQHATADTTRKALTPIAKNTSTGLYAVYENAGANDIDKIIGFSAPDDWIQLNGSTVITSVMVAGEVEYADIEKLGVLDATFKADLLASGLDKRGIYVKGVDGFYTP